MRPVIERDLGRSLTSRYLGKRSSYLGGLKDRLEITSIMAGQRLPIFLLPIYHFPLMVSLDELKYRNGK